MIENGLSTQRGLSQNSSSDADYINDSYFLVLASLTCRVRFCSVTLYGSWENSEGLHLWSACCGLWSLGGMSHIWIKGHKHPQNPFYLSRMLSPTHLGLLIHTLLLQTLLIQAGLTCWGTVSNTLLPCRELLWWPLTGFTENCLKCNILWGKRKAALDSDKPGFPPSYSAM